MPKPKKDDELFKWYPNINTLWNHLCFNFRKLWNLLLENQTNFIDLGAITPSTPMWIWVTISFSKKILVFPHLSICNNEEKIIGLSKEICCCVATKKEKVNKGKGKDSNKRNMLLPYYNNENGEDFSKRFFLLPCYNNENDKHSLTWRSYCCFATRKEKWRRSHSNVQKNYKMLGNCGIPYIITIKQCTKTCLELRLISCKSLELICHVLLF